MSFKERLASFLPGPVAERFDLPSRKDKKVYDLLSNDLSYLFGVSNELTGKSIGGLQSMKIAVVYACVRLISGGIAQMPVRIYTEGPLGKRPARKMTERLLNRNPSPLYTGPMFLEWVVSKMLLEGNAFAAIMRDGMNNVREILPVESSLVEIHRKNGRLEYSLSFPNDQETALVRLSQDDVLHFSNFGYASYSGNRSPSILSLGASNAIALEESMEEYSANFFTKGALQRYAIIREGTWTDEQRTSLRQRWMDSYAKGVSQMSAPMVFDKTVDVKTLGINQRDAQLLESREFQITDIARAFGVPSMLINQEQKTTSWGAGVAQIGRAFTQYTLMPHIRRIEAEFERKLYPYTNELVRLDTSALTRPTTKERYESYNMALGGNGMPGFLSINEVRDMEDLPMLEGEVFEMPYDGRTFAHSMNGLPVDNMKTEEESIEHEDV